MPLSRYQIRNEYTLADPELYRAADKDDPEALLEGVAMAGLVGVLRQLGDLAEFAAEIFHDLHEEVMATAARGHGLMVRVQQLEVEFPSIEKAFLSQTNHSQFISNPGVEWHPNLHADQNLITQGDLPRFIMDSYEECRGPPRLFLLDKFDMAGAGACLKRYTDPSFYKVETSNAEVQRERKARKTKKKGSRWRNGETPEVLPTSHVKLQQLFLEERIENGVSDPARLVKLKRRLNSNTRKSYMEKIIITPLAEDKLVHEISIGSPASKLASNITSESGLQTVEISAEKPAKTNSSPCLSPDMEKAVLKSSKDDFADEKEIAVDGDRTADASGDDYQYDDIASEIDNYMDALTTMESEIETDTEIRAKSDTGFFKIEKQRADSDANEEQLQAQFSDSQSMGNSTASDDGNSSSKKGISSFSYSDTASTSAENTPVDGDDASVNVSPSNEKFEDGITNMLSNQISSNEEIAVIQTCHNDSAPKELPVDEGEISTQRTLGERELDELFDSGLVDAKENATNETNVDDNLPFASKLSDVPLPTNDDSPIPVSAIDQPVDKVDEEESSVFSGELEVAPEKESMEVLQDSLVQTEDAEDIATKNSVISVAEEPPFVRALSESETCRSDVTTDAIVSADDVGPSGGKIEANSSEAEETLNITERQISEITGDVDPLNPDSADIEETEIVESETPVEAIAVSVPDIDDAKEDESNSPSANFTDLQEESVSSVKELDKEGLEIDETCVEQNHKEPGTLKEDNPQAASPESNSVTTSSDYSKSELLNNVPDDHSDSEVLNDSILESPQTAEAESTLHLDDAIAVPSYSENNDQDSDSKSSQLNNLVIEDAEDTLSSPTHSKSSQLNNLIIEDAEDTLSSPTHSFAELEVNNIHADHLELPHAVEESPDSYALLEKPQSPQHMDEETPVDTTYAEQKVESQTDELDFESISQLEQMQPPLDQADNEISFDASPESTPADRPSEASVTELLTQPGSHKLEISEQAKEEPLPSAFPVFGLVPVVSEINLEEMPPLPPLPPVQWRMGKPSLASERASAEQRNIDHFSQMFPSNPILPHSAVEYGNSQTVMVGNTVHSSPISLPIPTMSNINSEHYTQPMNPFLEVRETYEERPQHSSLAEQGTSQPWVNQFSTLGTIADTSSSTHASGSPREEFVQPLHQLPQEENSEDKKIEPTPISDLKVVNPPMSMTEPSPIIEKEQPQYVLPTAEGRFMWSSSAAPFAPAVEDGKPNGNRPLKLMRPRSPLIDAVAAHDKSKLRKVTERVQPQIQKVDERDSLLEQIRTKSFNLKPALATRPSIQGPKTNLRVAAILEKANAIRQALAGSDEDDDADSWSSD